MRMKLFWTVQKGWYVISQQFRYIEMHMSNDPAQHWRNVKQTSWTNTHPKTNMSPENQWLEYVFPIEIVPFLRDMLVFRGVNSENTCQTTCLGKITVIFKPEWWGYFGGSLHPFFGWLFPAGKGRYNSPSCSIWIEVAWMQSSNCISILSHNLNILAQLVGKSHGRICTRIFQKKTKKWGVKQQ